MKTLGKVIIAVLLFVVLLVGCTQEVVEEPIHEEPTQIEGLTMEERLEDLEYLHNTIAENYAFLSLAERLHGINWLDRKESYIEAIKKTTTNQEFQREISRIVASLNDDHTHVVDQGTFRLMYGIYTDPLYEEYNKLWASVLKDDTVLEWYGFKPGSNTNDVRPPVSNQPAYYSRKINDDVAYLRIYTMSNDRVSLDTDGIREFFQEVKDFEKLIIDIRGNGGGNSNYWAYNIVPPLINETLSVDYYYFVRGEIPKKFYESRGLNFKLTSELSKDILDGFPEEVKTQYEYYYINTTNIEPRDPVGFRGDIYLLVDNSVYSSAESFAAFAKDSGFATLVGGRTGGDGIGIDPFIFSLPNSGIVVRSSGILGLNADGTINAETRTVPHYVLDDPRRDTTIDRDRVIQFVIDK